ncbi:MAG: hypothetical protein QW165_04595, partial [Candidatus Woesearchaeota archaeon]
GPKEEFNPSGDVYPFSTPKTDFLHTLKGKKSEFKNLPQVTDWQNILCPHLFIVRIAGNRAFMLWLPF